MAAARSEASHQSSTRPLEDHDFSGGLAHDRIGTSWFLEGPIDRDGFRLYVKEVLPAGAKLFFLPKYSLDLNPIEQVFAKLKHLLRKAAARPSTPFASRSARYSSSSCPNNAQATWQTH
jgi:hypothetical protein